VGETEAKGYAEGESNPCRLLSVTMEGKHDNHFTIGVYCFGQIIPHIHPKAKDVENDSRIDGKDPCLQKLPNGMKSWP
jgi:hypothetical protein